jgi:hypothetical protein
MVEVLLAVFSFLLGLAIGRRMITRPFFYAPQDENPTFKVVR